MANVRSIDSLVMMLFSLLLYAAPTWCHDQLSDAIELQHEQRCFATYTAAAAAATTNRRLAAWLRESFSSFEGRHSAVQRMASGNLASRRLVLGAGFGSTGTTSIREALLRLGLANAWHATRGKSCNGTSPNGFRLPIMRAWDAGPVCRAQLERINYRPPPCVEAWVDRPSAESFLDV